MPVESEDVVGIVAFIIFVVIIISIIIAMERSAQQCRCKYHGVCGPLCGCGGTHNKESQGGCMYHSGSMTEDKARKFKNALTGSGSAAGPRTFRNFEVREYATIVS